MQVEVSDIVENKSFGVAAAKSALYVGAAQVTKMVCMALSIVALTRLLSPGDFGVVAMVAPISALINLFQDFGLSQATVQAKSHSPSDSTSLFWFTVMGSCIMAAVLVLLSPLVGLFYSDPRAAYLAAASSLTVIATSLGLQHFALLNREMRFGWISISDGVNALVTLAVTILAALMIRSYWALWIGTTAGQVSLSIMYWRGVKWRPSGKPNFSGVKAKLGFGANVAGANLLNFLIRNADNVLIARFRGAAELGLYDRSYKLMMLPLSSVAGPLSRVMVPILCRQVDDPKKFRRTFVLALHAFVLLTFPGILVSAIFSKQLIALLLGEKWLAAAPIYFWLSLSSLVQVVMNPTGWLFIASGRVKEQVVWATASAFITLAGFILGLRWGAVGISISLFITMFLRVPFLIWYSTIGTGVSQVDLYKVVCEPLLASPAVIIMAALLKGKIPTLYIIFASLLLSYGLSILFTCFTNQGRETSKGLVMYILRPAIDRINKVIKSQAS